MPWRENDCVYTNDFVKPKDQRELARFGLARNRTFKNVFVKREQRKLAYSAERRADERANGEPSLLELF